ncbi:hypothetical protein VIBHAR_06473 [Vibrio campbellii ATCC BAA-1116]|uniref:Uncharacterized protein n=1 Tax=Vibrio campbellii (strain ATCC BAA-1116) TaxID=2902295 RepID=A7N851_VIBC1|nr:hypothetical protein VIBHAR_06473 [Vibrio campbellii ATCC BAA-1116]
MRRSSSQTALLMVSAQLLIVISPHDQKCLNSQMMRQGRCLFSER